MAAPLIQLPKELVINQNGVLVSGALAEFFLAGTSTQENVFQDSALAVPHTNPVVADANGVFPPIYRDPNKSYKIDIQDSLGASLDGYPVDNVGETLTPASVQQAFQDTTAAETTAGATVTDFFYPERHVKRYGALWDAATNDLAALEAADAVGAVLGLPAIIPEGVGLINGAFTCTGKGIKGAGPMLSTLRAGASMSTMIQSTSGSDVIFEDFTIDGNDNVSVYLLNIVTPDGATVQRVNATKWSSGIRFASDATTAAKKILARDIIMFTPALVSAGLPIAAQSTTAGQQVEDCDFDNIKVYGVPGEFSSGNQQTADQIVFQGVLRGSIRNCLSKDGGENGMTIGRLTEQVQIVNNIVEGCDGHGIQAGTAFVRITVASASNFTVNDTLTQQAPEESAAGTLQALDGDDCYMNGVTGGQYVVGATVSNGSNSSTITAIKRSNRIDVSHNISRNNGLDVGGGSGTLAAFFTQQSDDCSFGNNKGYDDQATKTQDHGLFASQCKNVHLGAGNDFQDNESESINAAGLTTFAAAQFAAIEFPDIPSAIQLESGAFTFETTNCRVDSEGASGPDTLTTINGGTEGKLIMLRIATGSRAITVEDAAGNIRLDHTNRSILTGSDTVDPIALGVDAGETHTITVTGAVVGDFVDASFSLDLQGVGLTAWVSAADTVSCRFENNSIGGTPNLGSGTLRVRVKTLSNDYLMDSIDDGLWLMYREAVSAWIEVARSDAS